MAPRVHWQNAKKWEWFFLEVSCVKNCHFFTAPGGQKRHYFAQFFFLRISIFDHRLVHLGWFIWVFWEFMMKKMINFSAQWHIKVFLEFKLFEILNFLFWITPTAIWECISWLPGFIGKMRRNENDFFLEVSCVKNYQKLPFFTSLRWSEKALFCTIFFSPNIDSDHRSVHLGWFIWVFCEFMMKKMINFPAQWHIKEF